MTQSNRFDLKLRKPQVMKNPRLLLAQEPEAADVIREFVDSKHQSVSFEISRWMPSYARSSLAEALQKEIGWNEEERRAVVFLLELAGLNDDYGFLRNLVGVHEQEVLSIMSGLPNEPDPGIVSRRIIEDSYTEWTWRSQPDSVTPFVSPFCNFAWRHFDLTMPVFFREGLVRALSRWRPEHILALFRNDPVRAKELLQGGHGLIIATETEIADQLIVETIQRSLLHPGRATPHSIQPSSRSNVFKQLCAIHELRKGAYKELVIQLASHPEFSSLEEAVAVLMDHLPDEAIPLITRGVGPNTPWSGGPAYQQAIRRAIEGIHGDGKDFLERVLIKMKFRYGLAKEIVSLLLADPAPEKVPTIRKLFLDYSAGLVGKPLNEFWANVALSDQGTFQQEWREMAVGKSKPLREIAASWLQIHNPVYAIEEGKRLVASGSSDDRVAGVTILGSSGTPEAIAILSSMHGTESTKQVRLAIADSLSKHGIHVADEPEKEAHRIEDIESFEADLQKRVKSIRPPKAIWLDLDELPPLLSKSGNVLSKLAVTYLFQQQAKGSAGSVAPEIESLLPHLNRAGNSAFVHGLLDQWFDSPMKAADRWALDVAGLTGDESIIVRLVQPIPRWCEMNRGSIAEWVVHAIALLGSEAALGALDGLFHRYRNHRKYVSEAASVAIQTTASMLGISEDELAERIVPDFGFDSAGRREFQIKGGKATAVLKSDFKILWSDPETGGETVNPPGKLTPAAEESLKTTKKHLKEAVTHQTLRLESGLISARRWTVDGWRARFEHHPVFRYFAMRLIWGLYDESDMLLRTFRLYPNGLTADATGNLEEFGNSATSIGLIHPMALTADAAKEWISHLKRFKVKPLFKQLDRPVHLLDPLHGNRKEIRLTEGVGITAGDLRMRMLGRGWSLGSTGDGGWIRCMYRKFPKDRLEVYLPVRDLHATSTKGAEVVLESAFFSRTTTGNRAYRDRLGEAKSLAFEEIPALIYSETISVLKALVES